MGHLKISGPPKKPKKSKRNPTLAFSYEPMAMDLWQLAYGNEPIAIAIVEICANLGKTFKNLHNFEIKLSKLALFGSKTYPHSNFPVPQLYPKKVLICNIDIFY